MSDNTESIINANRLAERINQAKQLRAEGATEEAILAVEPTKEEIREALIALRSRRQAQPTSTSTKRQPKTLAGLLEEGL